MTRILYLLVLFVISGATGCSLCSSPQDAMYSAYGGRWQRDDMCCGRVGSVLDPAGSPVGWTDVQVTPAGLVPVSADDAPPPPPAP